MEKRNQSLDVLRFAAIFGVFIAHLEPDHFSHINDLKGAEGFFFWKIKSFGKSGVDLFFVLSGFLISGIIFSEIKRRNP